LIDVLFLVVLVALYVLCPMIDASRVNAIQEALEECEGEDILSNYSLVKGKCVLDLLS
jgi:hypothetical protein